MNKPRRPKINVTEAILSDVAWRATPDLFGNMAMRLTGRTPFQLWPHVQYIGSRIAKAVTTGKGRLLINIPPGHGKSTLTSFWTPIWLLDNMSDQRVICASHGAELANYWGRLVRNEFEQNPILTTRLRDDSQAANRWNTASGGGMVCVGVGGGVTGFRGNLLLFDDPYATWADAYSPTKRQHVQDWFNGTFYDRGEPGATIVVIMHRWHDEDLAGFLAERHSDPWEVIRLPALAEAGDPLGRALGEALCPARFPREDLEQTRRADASVFGAKYQQNPQGIGTDRVYDRFIQTVHEDKTLTFDLRRGLDLSFDFNRNPGMHVEAGQHMLDLDQYACIKEFHAPFLKLLPALELIARWIGDDYGYGMKGVDAWVDAKLHQSSRFPFPVVEFFADASGTQERAETTESAIDMVINFFKRRRWPLKVRIPVKNPPMRDRIDTFNEALMDGDGEPHYKVHPQCTRLIADFKELKTDEAGLIDKEKSKLSHASDAEGYRLHYLRPIRRAAEKPKSGEAPERRVLTVGG